MHADAPELLSPHFTLVELCATAHGPNVPTTEETVRLRRLCATLERIRERWGPLGVTSGFRCEAVNRAVGGVPRSAHRTGDAADVHPLTPGVRVEDLWCWMPESGLAFDQCIWERKASGVEWLHVGLAPWWLKGPPRMQHFTLHPE